MEQFIYAQLDENDICIGVCYLSGLVELPNMLRLNEEGNVLGKKYNNGVWEEVVPPEPLPPPPPTTAEKIDYLVTDALDKDEVALDQTLMLLNIQLNQELAGGGETL